MFNSVPTGNTIPSQIYFYLLFQSQIRPLLQVSTTNGTALNSGPNGAGAGITSSYTVGSVFTDSRLQVGLFFRSFNSSHSQFISHHIAIPYSSFFRFFRFVLMRTNMFQFYIKFSI